jgi:hypothetical protein
MIQDVPAKGTVEQGQRDIRMGTHFLRGALGIGRDAFDGVDKAGFPQDCRELLAEGNVAASAVMPCDE